MPRASCAPRPCPSAATAERSSPRPAEWHGVAARMRPSVTTISSSGVFRLAPPRSRSQRDPRLADLLQQGQLLGCRAVVQSGVRLLVAPLPRRDRMPGARHRRRRLVTGPRRARCPRRTHCARHPGAAKRRPRRSRPGAAGRGRRARRSSGRDAAPRHPPLLPVRRTRARRRSRTARGIRRACARGAAPGRGRWSRPGRW